MNGGEIGRRGVAALLAAAVACLAGLALVPAAAPAADPADEIYDPSRMYVVDLQLPPASVNALNDPDEWFEYQPGQFSIAETDGTPEGVGPFSAPVNVGVRLKGSASFRELSGKSAFKVKFDKTELFRGLRVLTLNNMVEDPSMIHETLAYTAYRGSGVPGSRTGYAYVYVNGADYGVHLNIETMDRIALEKRFGAFDEETQHLYESEYDADVTPHEFELYEIDEGDEGDRSDLEALVAAVNSSGPASWAERVAAVADLQEMTRMWAVEKYIGQWDGYAGMEASWLPNNYYLYSDAAGRFQMMPWGNDETWQEPYHLAFDGPAGLMFDLCLADTACRAVYRDSVAAVHNAFPGMNLDALAVQSANLLDPWQVLEDEESTREEYGLEEIEEGVAETRQFIATRPAEAAAWLGLPDPLAPGLPSAGAQPAAGRQASMRVGSSTVAGRVLVTRLVVPGAGRLTQRATLRTRKGDLGACATRMSTAGAGVATVRCPLSAAIQRRRQVRWLKLGVTTRFRAANGIVESTYHRVRLPRLAPR